MRAGSSKGWATKTRAFPIYIPKLPFLPVIDGDKSSPVILAIIFAAYSCFLAVEAKNDISAP
jgi:hypothetical protein